MTSRAEKTIKEVLKLADIKVNGKRDSDIQVHNPKFYHRVLSQGSLGLGESYVESWWDCKALDKFFDKLLRAKLYNKVKNPKTIMAILMAKLTNPQSMRRSKEVTEKHYDLGNDFYADMLGKRMQYTCAYFKNTKSLDTAQEQKLDLICKKLKLKKGETVLELGCGWGGFAKFAATKYKVKVTSYNISKEQVIWAKEKTKGLPVKIIESDYRNATGLYDKVVSIGMTEHVGSKNYKTLIKVVDKCLKPGGLFLQHTIGRNDSTATEVDPWIHKYIFPGGKLPSVAQLSAASEKILVLEDFHNLGPDYDKTLMAWDSNFQKNWKKWKAQYGDTFYRMWKYYLLACAGGFRARELQLWQLVFSKDHEGKYLPVR